MLDLVGNSWNLGESYYEVVRILAEDPSIINLNEYRRFACLTTRRIEDELGLAVLFSYDENTFAVWMVKAFA